MHANTRRAHPVDHLVPVLVRLAAWTGCTTSGIEQLLSKVKTWLLTPRRRTWSPSRVEDEVSVACENMDKFDMGRLYRDAQSIYQKCYGKARNRSKAKLGSFAMSTKQARSHTEKDWIRQRRSDVRSEVAVGKREKLKTR